MWATWVSKTVNSPYLFLYSSISTSLNVSLRDVNNFSLVLEIISRLLSIAASSSCNVSIWLSIKSTIKSMCGYWPVWFRQSSSFTQKHAGTSVYFSGLFPAIIVVLSDSGTCNGSTKTGGGTCKSSSIYFLLIFLWVSNPCRLLLVNTY